MKTITFALMAAMSVSGGAASAENAGGVSEFGLPSAAVEPVCPECRFTSETLASMEVPLLDSGRMIVRMAPWRGNAGESRFWAWPDQTDTVHGMSPSAPAYTVGYAWRKLSIERSAFARTDRDAPVGSGLLRPDSSSTRFSFRPAPGWSFQISRGSLGGVDQINPADETRRTSISATYMHPLHGGNWQTTVAWGRSAPANREPSVGYLLESTARIDGAGTIFGRLEQVRSDELDRQNDSMQRELFKLRKLTVGYYRDLRVSGPVSVDVGAVASRYFVPAAAAPSYGSEPTTYMLFMRVRLR